MRSMVEGLPAWHGSPSTALRAVPLPASGEDKSPTCQPRLHAARANSNNA